MFLDYGVEPIHPAKQIYLFLWMIGRECATYKEISDRFDVSLDGAYQSVTRVLNFLSEIAPIHIRWPNGTELKQTQEYYEQVKKFPRVVGIVDGTHFKIDRPKNDKDSYYNKDEYFSVQAQITCNHKKEITDLFAGYPGSVHDSRVFRNSELKRSILSSLEGWYTSF